MASSCCNGSQHSMPHPTEHGENRGIQSKKTLQQTCSTRAKRNRCPVQSLQESSSKWVDQRKSYSPCTRNCLHSSRISNKGSLGRPILCSLALVERSDIALTRLNRSCAIQPPLMPYRAESVLITAGQDTRERVPRKNKKSLHLDSVKRRQAYTIIRVRKTTIWAGTKLERCNNGSTNPKPKQFKTVIKAANQWLKRRLPRGMASPS